MKTLVTFYSRTGNTKMVGNLIAGMLKCDVDEIIDTKNRKGIWGWLTSGKAGMKKELTKIEPPKKDPSTYDLIIIGTPIQMGPTAAARTYIRENKDKFKNVAFFCTYGSSGVEKTFNDMEQEAGKKPLSTFSITEKELKRGEGLTEKLSLFIKGF